MPDFDAISVALAARFDAGHVTPPAGYTNVRASLVDLPNQITQLPVVFTYPDAGTFDRVGNGTRVGVHRFVVRFYLQETIDLARELKGLRRWATVLVDQLKASTQLGGTVAVARVTTWRLGIFDYAATSYSGIELGVDITTSEAWQATA